MIANNIFAKIVQFLVNINSINLLVYNKYFKNKKIYFKSNLKS